MKLLKKLLVGSLILGLSVSSLTAGCEILTSPVDRSLLKETRASWQGQRVPIYVLKTKKYTDFLTAYKEFNADMTKMFKDSLCKKNGWSGVANYKIEWDIGDKQYNFIATYDMIDYK